MDKGAAVLMSGLDLERLVKLFDERINSFTHHFKILGLEWRTSWVREQCTTHISYLKEFRIMQSAFDCAVEYVHDRKQFDKPVGTFQIMQGSVSLPTMISISLIVNALFSEDRG